VLYSLRGHRHPLISILVVSNRTTHTMSLAHCYSLEFYPATPQTPFECFPAGNQDAAQMIDDLLSSIGSPVSLTPRRQSMVALSSPLRATFPLEECGEPDLHQQNGIPDSLPTPPHTGQLQSVSTFDLAPLPHPNFVSMAAVSMSSESEGESYYSPVSSMSPAFSSVPSTPEMKHATLYKSANTNAMPTVPEHSRPSISSLPALDLPQLAPAPRHLPGTPSPVRVRAPAPHLTQSLGAKSSGITMEEISSFISGPDQDGKWLCLFPECKKRFGRKENIKSHVQTHLGDRQYRCEACKKCFVRQHDLKRHSKIHTGVKPYPCLCGNSFARHDALTRHRQRGMCVGAFEGIVKKVVKRGRPRKKPLPEDSQKLKAEETSDSSAADGSSGSSNPQTPYELPDFGSPLPQTPSPRTPTSGEEEEATPRCRESSSDFLTQPAESPGYSPPTSPSDEYDFESFVSPPSPSSNRNSIGSSSLAESDFVPSYGPLATNTTTATTEQVVGASMKKFGAGPFGSLDEYASPSGAEEFGLFSQDGMDMLGLTALERDPSILNFDDDIYIKPEFMTNAENGSFY